MNKQLEALIAEMKAAAEKYLEAIPAPLSYSEKALTRKPFDLITTPGNVMALIVALEQAQHDSAVNWEAATSLVEENEELKRRIAAPQLPAVPTDDERLMEIEGISVVKLPNEFYSDQGIVVQLEKVMAALAVTGIEYKRGATVDEKANILSDEESEEHVIRQYRTEFSPWIQCSKQVYESKKADGLEVRVLHERTQLSAVPDLSDDQVLEFLTVAFRHNEIDGDIEFDDIRLGLKMAIAAAPKPE
jgi:hypothetical protein